MIDNSSMIVAINSIVLKENNTVGNIEVGKPITRIKPCPKITENKIDKTDKLYGGLTNDYRINPGLASKDDPESFDNNIIANKIISIFVGNKGYPVSSIVAYVKNAFPKLKDNKISSIIKKLCSSRQLVFNKLENKVYKNLNFSFEEDAEEDLKTAILNLINKNGCLTITGIVKELGPTITRATVTPVIRDLYNSGKIKSGEKPGYFYLKIEEDEEMGVMPVLDKETPETLKAKGWQEVKPGTYVGPDGVQKYIVSEGQSSNNKVNKNNMAKQNKFNFDLLREETEDFLSNLDREDDMTAGLDEFDQDSDYKIDVSGGDDEDYDDDPEEVTITFTRDELDLFRNIMDKINAGEDDGMIDDMATDENANTELMGDDETEVTDETETFESEDEDEEDEDDNAYDVEEDEESLANSVNSIFDGSFSNGSPSLKRHSEKPTTGKRAPIEDKYSPSRGQVSDGASSDGGAKMTRAAAAPKGGRESGKPVRSKVTNKAGSNSSIFKV